MKRVNKVKNYEVVSKLYIVDLAGSEKSSLGQGKNVFDPTARK